MNRTMLKLVYLGLTAAAAMSFAVSSADAQSNSSQQERRACTRDVSRHCRSVMDQGDMAVYQCLKANRSRLSASCGAVIDSH